MICPYCLGRKVYYDRQTQGMELCHWCDMTGLKVVEAVKKVKPLQIINLNRGLK